MAPRPPAGGGPDPRTIYLQTEATIERLRKLVPVIDQHIAELRRSGIELGPTRRGRER